VRGPQPHEPKADSLGASPPPSSCTSSLCSGAILTGLFADTRVTGFDGYSSGGGWINHNYEQLGASRFPRAPHGPLLDLLKSRSTDAGSLALSSSLVAGWQLASAVSTMAWTAVVTYIILFVVDHIPGLKLRCSEEGEILGIDEDQCGEMGYDYVRPSSHCTLMP